MSSVKRKRRPSVRKRSVRKRGRGIISKIGNAAKSFTSSVVNKIIDRLPVELHLIKPETGEKYSYCGPGTDLEKRLKRGDKGINRLDSLCKLHDIAYSQSSDNKSRAEADRKLADGAWEVFKDPKSGVSERAYSYLVTNLMKVKSAFGGRLGKRKRKRGVGKMHRQKAISQLKKYISGRGFYLKPYPISSGGRILVPPSLKVKKKKVKRRRKCQK